MKHFSELVGSNNQIIETMKTLNADPIGAIKKLTTYKVPENDFVATDFIKSHEKDLKKPF